MKFEGQSMKAVLLHALFLLAAHAASGSVEYGHTVRLLAASNSMDVASVTVEAEAEDGQTITGTTDHNGVAALILPDASRWTVRVVDDRLWSARTPMAAGAQNVTVRVWPAAQIVATLARNDGESLPDDLPVRARFLPVTSPQAPAWKSPGTTAVQLSSGEVACRREQSTDITVDPVRLPLPTFFVRCDVPAGIYNVRLRADGYVSHYAHGITLAPGALYDLGHITLQPGSSLVGHVAMEEGNETDEEVSDLPPSAADEDDETIVVELVPQVGTAAQERGEIGEVGSRTLEAIADAHGFFHMTGVAPGVYRLRAHRLGWLDATIDTLTVAANTEVALDAPLVLQRPLTLKVVIDPPLAPDGHPWVLSLNDPTRHQQVGAGAANDDGRWFLGNLTPGGYLLIVVGDPLGRVRAEMFDLARDATDLSIDLDLITVEGTLELSGAPLPGHVYFGGQNGVEKVTMKADEAGRFGGIVPRAGDWLVEVVSSDPRVVRKIAAVPVEPAADGVASVALSLENRVVRGRVVDATGEPLRDARVQVLLVSQSLPPVHVPQLLRADGTFEFAGQDDGQYVLQAIALRRGGMAQSAPRRVTVSEQAPEVEVDLVMTPMRTHRGTVRAPVGPIHGATVRGVLRDAADLSTSVMVPPETQSDVRGAFTLEVPAHAEIDALVIEAPGLMRHRRTLRPGETDLVVDLQTGGGTLVLGGDLVTLGAQPWLITSSGRESIQALRTWAASNGVPLDVTGANVLRVPYMPPGPYALCAGPRSFWQTLATLDESTCVVGTLLPDDTLKLRAPEVESEDDASLNGSDDVSDDRAGGDGIPGTEAP